ncbi:MAG TPA: hypothetical protein VFR61_01095 [Nitrososphaeraceae archaeon]|nr:hypothetical protein [Nitrososphaeraceae archaeon]
MKRRRVALDEAHKTVHGIKGLEVTDILQWQIRKQVKYLLTV